MFTYLSWINVIISGVILFNKINKNSTSITDGTYPTSALFTLVRFGVITSHLSHIIVIILSFPLPPQQYNWDSRLVAITDTFLKETDSHFIKLWLKYSCSNSYYYNTHTTETIEGEVGAYHSVLLSILPLSYVGKFPIHSVPMKYARILLQLKCFLLNLTTCTQFTKLMKKVFILQSNRKLCAFKTYYRPQTYVWQATHSSCIAHYY